MRPFSAAFLDRDGTLMRDTGYPRRREDVELIPGAAEAVARLNALSVPVVVVTNQSGIGRGRLTEAGFREVQAELERQLVEADARLDAVYHCPHDPAREACRCRKPAGGLFERAARDLGVSLEESLFVGDRERDIAFGVSLGAIGILIGPIAMSEGQPAGCRRAPDLATALDVALETVESAS